MAGQLRQHRKVSRAETRRFLPIRGFIVPVAVADRRVVHVALFGGVLSAVDLDATLLESPLGAAGAGGLFLICALGALCVCHKIPFVWLLAARIMAGQLQSARDFNY
jgi:hypothetical protein